MFVNSFLGYTMWDYESDAPLMWPEKQQYPTRDEDPRRSSTAIPKARRSRGKWGDVDFLKQVSELNPQLKDTQFADYHGHGWNFRAVFKRDRKGNLLDADGNDRHRRRSAEVQEGRAPVVDPRRRRHAVRRLPLLAGHPRQRPHLRRGRRGGRDRLQGLPRHGAGAIRLCCTSGPAALGGGTDLTLLRTPDGRRRFEWVGDALYPALDDRPEPRVEDEPRQEHGRPDEPRVQREGGARQADEPQHRRRSSGAQDVKADNLAHTDDEAGVLHLPHLVDHELRRLPPADRGELEDRAPPLRRRRDAQLRDLQPAGRARRHVPARPARAGEGRQDRADALVARRWCCRRPTSTASASTSSSRRSRRAAISSQAFTPHYPHTERKTETKTCTDCHLSKDNDNNAIMAQLLLHGTNFVNFVGFNAWVGGDGEISGVQVTEWDEPQAVIGSYLHRYAYPDWFAQHEKRGATLPHALQPRRRRRAAACSCAASICTSPRASGGMRVYDVASIANKGISQRVDHRAVRRRSATTRTSPRRTRPASRCRPTSRSIRRATRAT